MENILRKNILCFVMLTVNIITNAHDFKVDGIYYKITSSTKCAVTYKGDTYSSYSKEYNGDITIPESVIYYGDTYEVTSIAPYAFYDCSGLTSVTIPNSVTSIGRSAFYGCSGLTSVTIPNSVTSIGDYAFCGCSSLTSVTIPESVTSIESSAFSSCNGLTSIVVNGNNSKYDSRENCNAIIETQSNKLLLGCKNTTIPNSVTSIGDYAFYYCSGLTSITIPSSVTSIGDYAFYYCRGLTSITIPSSVTSIGDYAFYYCSGLTSVTIPNSVTSIGNGAFWGCSGLTSVTIPNSVTNIGYKAFQGCSGLTSVTIPNSVTSIGESAFAYCSSLASVTIPNSVTNIGSRAFYNTRIKSLTIGTGIQTIASDAFSYQFSTSGAVPVKVIWLANTPPSGYRNVRGTVNYVPNDSYSGLSRQKIYPFLSSMFEVDGIKYVPVSSSERTSDAIDCVYNESAENTKIGNTVTYKNINMTVQNVGDSICKDNTFIKELEFSYNGGILSKNFSGCSNITSITIGSGVKRMIESAFSDCKNLTSVTWNAKNYPAFSSYSSNPFYNIRTQITEFIMGDEVTSIPAYMCYGMSNLKSINIPNSVTSIGSSAFSGCSGLEKVIIPNIKNWCSIRFSSSTNNPLYYAHHLYSDETTEITNLVIPDSVTTIENYTFSGCSGLAEIIIPDSVKSIGKNAFSGCTGIRSVTIPSNVSSMGNSAFAGCSNIRSVKWNAKKCNSSNNPFSDAPYIYEFVVGKDVINIPDYLFYGMNNLRSLTIGAGVLTIGNQGGVTPAKVFWMPNTPPTGCNNVSGMVNYTSNDSFSQPNNSSSLQNIRICRYLSSIFEVDGVRYVLVSPSERTCNAIDCVYDSTLCEVNIDKTVGYKGINLQVKDINPYTFYSNTYIKKAYIDTDGELGAHAFENCNNMTVCTMGDRITKIDDYAFSGCKVLHRAGVDLYQEEADYNGIIVSKAVSYIGDYAFYGCSNIKNVIMEDRKENDMQLTLGSNGSLPLFSSCPLDSVYIGRNITYSTASSAGYSPFYRNTSLRTVHITDKETEISENEFYGCTNLKNVRIGDGVTYIGNWAFSGCSSIEYFSFGSAMQSIGKEAFSDCTAMTKLISHAMTPPVCDSQALDDISKWVCTLSVPKGTVSSYQQAAQWKEFFFIDEGATGIQRTVSNDSKSFRTYNINGYEQNGQQRGLNIIRMSDGTVKKVMVK